MGDEESGLEARSLEGLGDFSKLIEVLRAKFLPEQSLSTLTSNEEKVRHCLQNSDILLGFERYMNNSAFVKQGKEAEKSSEKAKELRVEGIKCFRNKKFHDSLRLFSKAVVVAPILDEGHELAHAYANRSAALFHLNHFTDCLNDVSLALEFGYPASQQQTLFLRKTLCYKALGKRQEAEESLAATLSLVPDAGHYDEIDESARDQRPETAGTPTTDSAENYRKFVQSSFDNFTAEVSDCDQEVRQRDHLKPVSRPGSKLTNASEWVKVASDPTKGRLLKCTRGVARDEVVITETAFASVLNAQFFDSFCYNCCEELRSRLYACHSCSTVAFCSKDCFTRSWDSYHGQECPDLQVILSMGILRLSLRILLVAGVKEAIATDREAGSSAATTTTSKQQKWSCDYKSLYQLSDHGKDLSYLVSARQTLAASFMLFLLSEKLKLIDSTDEDYYRVGGLLLKQIHQISVNSIVLFHQPIVSGPHDIYGIDVKSQAIGSAIFPTVSLMNHSCVPNTELFYKGNTVFVKTMQPLVAGQEITLSYGPIFKKMSRAERLDTLSSQYYFRCDCNACSDRLLDQESLRKPLQFPILTEAYFCSCRGPLVVNSVTEGMCLKCGTTSDVREITERVESAKKVMNVGKALVQFGRSQEAEKQFQKTLTILSKVCWPENRYLLAINSELLAVSLYTDNLEEARKYCEECNRIKRASFGENSYESLHGSLQLLNLKWAQHRNIAATMNQVQQANRTTRTPQMHKKLLTRLVSESVALIKSVKQNIRENQVSGELVLLDSSLVSCLKEMVELEKNLKACQKQ